MHAVDRLDRKQFEQAVLDHHPAAGNVLFRRLKDEVHGAVEAPRVGEILGGAEQHRRVPVVATGMHLAVDGRGVIEGVFLVDIEGIQIGAQANGAV